MQHVNILGLLFLQRALVAGSELMRLHVNHDMGASWLYLESDRWRATWKGKERKRTAPSCCGGDSTLVLGKPLAILRVSNIFL